MIKDTDGISLIDFLKEGKPDFNNWYYSKELDNLIYNAVDEIISEPICEKESMVLVKMCPYIFDKCSDPESWFIKKVAKLFAEKNVRVKQGSISIMRCPYTISPFVVLYVYWYDVEGLLRRVPYKLTF